MEVGWPAVIALRLDQRRKSLEFHRVARDQVHVVGRGIARRIRQAVRAGKVGIDRADFGGLLVHQLDEIRDRAVPDIVGKHRRGFVRAWEHYGVEKLSHRKRFVLQKPGQPDSAERDVLPVHLVLDVALHRDRRRIQVRDVFEGQDHRHDLGKLGGLHPLVRVFLIDHHVAVEVVEVNRFGVDLERRGISRRFCRGGQRGEAKEERKQDCRKFFHGEIPPDMLLYPL